MTISPAPDGRAQLEDDICTLVAQVLNLKREFVGLASSFELDLGMDSLAMVELNVALDERFGVKMPDVALPHEIGALTVQDLVGYIAGRIGAPASAGKLS